jgi:hypothetical protein
VCSKCDGNVDCSLGGVASSPADATAGTESPYAKSSGEVNTGRTVRLVRAVVCLTHKIDLSVLTSFL